MRRLLTGLGATFVIVLIVFALLIRFAITLNTENMIRRSEVCAASLEGWTEKIVSELSIYKQTMEQMYADDDEGMLEFMKTSYEASEDYPIGLYAGDDQGGYFDAAGWKPGDEYVVTERPWYTNGAKSETFEFGEPYIDSMLGKMCVSVSARMAYTKSTRVVAADVYMDVAEDIISDIVVQGNVDGIMLVSKDKKILVDSRNGTENLGLGLDELDSRFYNELEATIDSGANNMHKTKLSDGTYNFNMEYIDTADWYLVSYVNENTFAASLRKMERITIGALLVVMAVLLVSLRWFSKTVVTLGKRAATDPLTGLANREGFEGLVKEFLQDKHDGGLLILLDLDHFKNINDSLGHPEGDKVLKLFADTLRQDFNRHDDLPARIGGDEFAVFVERNLTNDQIETMVSHFVTHAREIFKDYQDYGLSVSVGAARAGADDDYQTLYKNTDRVLYDVKEGGRNGYKIHKED